MRWAKQGKRNEETRMKLKNQRSLHAIFWLVAWLMCTWMCDVAKAQGVTTTTVQGTVYLANGQAGSGTFQLSWPAFTTANNRAEPA